MSLHELVKKLREMTSCGVVDCKKALQEANGDIKEAVEKDTYRHHIFGASKARGGRQEYAGIFWADFSKDLSPHANELIPQIVGHTPDRRNNLIRKVGNKDNVINVDVAINKVYGGGKDAWGVLENMDKADEAQTPSSPLTLEGEPKADPSVQGPIVSGPAPPSEVPPHPRLRQGFGGQANPLPKGEREDGRLGGVDLREMEMIEE